MKPPFSQKHPVRGTNIQRPVVLAGAAALLLAAVPARSSNIWDGGGANGKWSTLLNWDDDLLPTFATGITFSGTTGLVTTNDLTALTVGGITFDFTAGSFSLDGAEINLSGNIVDNSTSDQEIHLGMVLNATQTINIASGGTLTIAAGATGTGVLSGVGGLTKTGEGTLVLGATNTYTGDTILDGGTLRFAAPNTGVKNLVFGPLVESTNASTLEIAGANVTATGLNVQTSGSAFNLLNIAENRTLTVNGAMTVGANVNGLNHAGVVTLLNAVGGGTLEVNGGTNSMSVALPRGNGDSGADPSATLDMSGLANFKYTGTTGELRVGAGNAAGTLMLANTSNVITAAQIRVGDSGIQPPGNGGNNIGGVSTLSLGAGTNVINTNTIVIGAAKSSANFNFQTITGTLNIAGLAGGSSTANITVGNGSTGTASGVTAQFQLAGHEVNIQAGTFLIGQLAGASGGGVGGNVTFDTGTLTVNNLQLGVNSNGAAPNGSVGTLTVGGPFSDSPATGVLTVNNQFFLANRTNTTTLTNQGSGTLIINGGTVRSNVDILDASTAGNAGTHNTTLTLAGGKLDLTGHNIGSATAPITTLNFLSGTLMNVNSINGSGGVNMTGFGTLILDGTNNYSGGTIISSGTLQVGAGGNGGTMGTGPITNNGVLAFNRTGTLVISSAINGSGSVRVDGSGTITLSAASNYAGETQINAGTLSVTGSIMSAVTINAGGTLSGIGNGTTTGVVGNVTLAVGGTIQPGATSAAGDVGALAMSAITINGGNLQFDLGVVSDVVIVTGNANFTAASTISPNASAPAGTYTLLSAGSLTLGVMPTIQAPVGTRKTFTADFGTPSAIKLIVSGSSKTLTWSGAAGNVWDVGAGGAVNWKDGLIDETFFSADTVTFGDGPTNRIPTINGITVLPAAVTVNNSLGNDYTIAGTGSIGGSTTISKSGNGALTLAIANTNTGAVTLNAGVLSINNANALGTGGFIINGGTLDNTSGAALTVATNNSQSWNADFSFAGTNSLDLGTGAVTLGSNRTVTVAANTLTVGGTIAGGFGLTKAGAGTLALTGNNSFSSTTISAGTLRLGNGGTSGTLGAGTVSNNGTLLFNRGDAFNFATLIDGTGGVQQIGPGVLTLSGANTYTGTTVIANSTIRVTNAAVAAGNSSLGSLSGGAVTIAAGATLDLSGSPTAQALNFGQKQFNVSGTGVNGLGAIFNGGVSQFNAFQNIVLTGDATFGGSQRYDIRSVPTSSLASTLDLAGNTLTKIGTNQFSLVGTNVTDGDIVVNQGTFSLETVTAIPDFGTGKTITLNSGSTLQFFQTTGPVSSILRPMVFNGITVFNNNQANPAFLGSRITFGGDNLFNIGNGALTLSGNISEVGGARALTKTGTGTLILGGANTYSGLTTISTGTLQVGTGDAGGTLGTGAVVDNAALVFNRSDDATVANAIGGTGTLEKQGLGALLLTGDSTYTGATTVVGGRLLVGNGVSGSIAGTTSVLVAFGASLGGSGSISTPGGNVALTGGSFLSPGNNGAGTLTVNTDFGQFDISGAASGTGAFAFDLGTVSDKVVMATGSLSIGFGVLDLDDFVFSNAGGFGAGTYVLFDTNVPISTALGPNVSGTVLGFDATLSLGDGGKDVMLVVVPEPASGMALVTGVAALLALRRRRPLPV